MSDYQVRNVFAILPRRGPDYAWFRDYSGEGSHRQLVEAWAYVELAKTGADFSSTTDTTKMWSGVVAFDDGLDFADNMANFERYEISL